MLAYIETKVTRILDKIPDDKSWFASSRSDALQTTRFDETVTTYEEVDCIDDFDANQEVLRRRNRLIELYSDKSVWFDVKQICEDDYNFASAKNEAFERKFAK